MAENARPGPQQASQQQSGEGESGVAQRVGAQASPLDAKIADSPRMVAQRERLAALDPAAAPAVQRKAASGGLPPGLQAGVETLSGHAMDDVRVHYNSSKPAQMAAHAYAQGTDIHLAPGQERHLPHEAWHVVQQKQGRVGATTQLQGVKVNDDPALEREADVMGSRAMQLKRAEPVSLQTALQHAARPLQRVAPTQNTVVQGAFLGYTGPGFAPNNLPLGANMDAFPGGANNNAGGQQAGATARAINIASSTPYAAPNDLGGFTHFSAALGNGILFQPGGNKRYTHMHLINGKLHGPGTVNNLVLGSTADNNHHRAQIENPLRVGLAAADTATTYDNELAADPPNFLHADVAYWNGPVNPAMVGRQAAAPNANVNVAGVAKPYTHSADPAGLGKATRWIHYTVVPTYGGVLSPTIQTNIVENYHASVGASVRDLGQALNLPAAAAKNAYQAAQAAVTLGALAGGVGATILAGNVAAENILGPLIPAAADAQNQYLNYKADMAAWRLELINFAAWAAQAFPTSLVCDADLYKASYDPASRWFKRSEAQEILPINQN
ncbi:DUF4157 domain-containing protein [Dyella choica]|uniref:DUF4157 domain-containing protein n=1 Tax=Dyella choica TaxID=1927959 RepID=A0A432MC42_9GAMM|nr:DUF4157 domain-containing protein [Dyella choica]RUL79938.1 DUF4157 domain-containing protein [Dyella choica]